MFDYLKSLGKAFTEGMGLNAKPIAKTSAENPKSASNASKWTENANALNKISAELSESNGGGSVPPKANTAVPDKPAPFGHKCSWLCVKADSSEEVIEKVGLKDPRVCNWNDGVYGERGVFVSPVLDGFVLVVNWGDDVLDTDPARLDELAKKFSELQFFATHRVSEYHAWVKYVDGVMVRGYGWCGDIGEVLLNNGEITPEEEELGLDNLLPDNEADWDEYEFPDEENVLEIAAAWGIDTSFTRKTYPESTGFLCDIN
ncbi:MAG: hypothetical protein HDT43_09435 [Ruminococcaceae bacterium]|nr:hypothetical protein [Oscillospiraceae bacterium]